MFTENNKLGNALVFEIYSNLFLEKLIYRYSVHINYN